MKERGRRGTRMGGGGRDPGERPGERREAVWGWVKPRVRRRATGGVKDGDREREREEGGRGGLGGNGAEGVERTAGTGWRGGERRRGEEASAGNKRGQDGREERDGGRGGEHSAEPHGSPQKGEPGSRRAGRPFWSPGARLPLRSPWGRRRGRIESPWPFWAVFAGVS